MNLIHDVQRSRQGGRLLSALRDTTYLGVAQGTTSETRDVGLTGLRPTSVSVSTLFSPSAWGAGENSYQDSFAVSVRTRAEILCCRRKLYASASNVTCSAYAPKIAVVIKPKKVKSFRHVEPPPPPNPFPAFVVGGVQGGGG